jgi:hypothetical protein
MRVDLKFDQNAIGQRNATCQDPVRFIRIDTVFETFPKSINLKFDTHYSTFVLSFSFLMKLSGHSFLIKHLKHVKLFNIKNLFVKEIIGIVSILF